MKKIIETLIVMIRFTLKRIVMETYLQINDEHRINLDELYKRLDSSGHEDSPQRAACEISGFIQFLQISDNYIDLFFRHIPFLGRHDIVKPFYYVSIRMQD